MYQLTGLTLAPHLHVEKMQNVIKETELLHVHVSEDTLEIHTLPVGQNVPSILNAQPIKPVEITNVLTHVLDYVVSMLPVVSSIILPPVLAIKDTLEIHLDHVSLFLQVSLYKVSFLTFKITYLDC